MKKEERLGWVVVVGIAVAMPLELTLKLRVGIGGRTFSGSLKAPKKPTLKYCIIARKFPARKR